MWDSMQAFLIWIESINKSVILILTTKRIHFSDRAESLRYAMFTNGYIVIFLLVIAVPLVWSSI